MTPLAPAGLSLVLCCALGSVSAVSMGGTINTIVGSPKTSYRNLESIWVAPSGDAYLTLANSVVRFENGAFGPRRDGLLVPILVAGSPEYAGSMKFPDCPSEASFGYGRPAALACVNDATAAITDSLGNVVITAVRPGRVQTVRASDGVMGLLTEGYSWLPDGLAIDANDTMYVADAYANRVWAVHVSSGLVAVFAGNGEDDFSGDGGPAENASLRGPESTAVDCAGNVYIADSKNNRVRVVRASDGIINTYAGGNSSGSCGDGGPATLACLEYPAALAVSPAGDLFIASADYSRVRVVWASNFTVDTYAGDGDSPPCDSGDGGPARLACFNRIGSIATDHFGNLWIRDGESLRIVWAVNGTISTLFKLKGSFCGDGGLGTSTCLATPEELAYGPSGDLFISDHDNRRVRVLNKTTGFVSTIAGTGAWAGCADYRDGMPATSACIEPDGLAVDGAGNVFIANGPGNVYVVWASNATIYRYAGGGSSQADGILARNAAIYSFSVALSCAGDLLLADWGTRRLRIVWASNQTIDTLAGNGSVGACGDGGPARDACLGYLYGVAVDSSSCNIIVSQSLPSVVRVIDAKSGTIDTLAGNTSSESKGFSGDGGPATRARLNYPFALAVDTSGNVLISDRNNNRIRVVWKGNKSIDTFAGDGDKQFNGDGGAATDASLNAGGIAVDRAGNVAVADFENDRVRIIMASNSVQCPVGYACPFGVPAPCLTAAAGYCPGDTLSPVPFSPGYYAVASSDAPVGLIKSQRLCPRGSYCADGVITRCPSGTIGTFAGKSTPDACIECPAGTYAALDGLTDVSAGCLPCPQGSTAPAAGSSFCSWCPPGAAFDLSTGQCAPCPQDFFSMGGTFPCQAVPIGAKSTVWDDFALLSEATVTSIAPGTPSATSFVQYSLPSVTGLVLIAVLPALYLAVTWCCRRCKGQPASDSRIDRALKSIDQFGLNHSVPEGQGPVMRSTAHGGALAVFAVGIAAAIAASLVIDFVTSNEVERSPLMAPTMSSYMSVPPATANQLFHSDAAPTSGLRVRVFAMGPACDSVVWSSSILLGGNFSYSAAANASTGAAVHDFFCPDCALSSISALDVSFDDTCQTFLVHTYAVSSTGFVSMASYSAAAPCGPRYSDASADCGAFRPAVAMAMTLDLLEVDGVNTARGFTVLPSATLPPEGGNLSSGLRLLRIALPLASSYVAKAVEKKTTLAQLASSILGLVGILSAAGKALSMLEAAPGHYHAFIRRLSDWPRPRWFRSAGKSDSADCEAPDAAPVAVDLTAVPRAESELALLIKHRH